MRTVVRSRDEKYVLKKIKELKRRGWEPVMEPKSFLMLDGTEEWVCVLENDKIKAKKHPFTKHYY